MCSIWVEESLRFRESPLGSPLATESECMAGDFVDIVWLGQFSQLLNDPG